MKKLRLKKQTITELSVKQTRFIVGGGSDACSWINTICACDDSLGCAPPSTTTYTDPGTEVSCQGNCSRHCN